MHTHMNGSRSPKVKGAIVTKMMELGTPIDAKKMEEILPDCAKSVSSFLSQLYQVGILDRRKNEDGIYEYMTNKKTKDWQKISMTVNKREPVKETPKVEKRFGNVSIVIGGISMTIEEAMEFYIQLQQLFK